MADFTTIADMVTIPEHFSQYVVERTTELNTFVGSGIATPDERVAKLINGSPEGGRFIYLPSFNPLDGEEDVFGEDDVSIGGVDTKEAKATLLIRQKAWGSTDLAHVLSGADPMGAIAQLIADWRNKREQVVYLSILKGLFGTGGALLEHLNDISGVSGEGAYISNSATLDTKQLLGDHYDSLGMVFMHSAVYTYLQKNAMISRTPIFNPAGDTVEIQTYLGYRIKVDDGMPYISYEVCESSTPNAVAVTEANIKAIQAHCEGELTAGTSYVKAVTPVYQTYFLGSGAFIRQDGTPAGFIGTETDRDKLGAKNILINRWCQIITPRGFSWESDGSNYVGGKKYPSNADLANPANWSLATDHKKVSIACLKHKIG